MADRPSGMTADKNKRTLTVTWNDGHVSDYPFALLRAACPCASCRGGHERMSALPDPEIFATYLPVDSPSTRMETLKAVGSYAIMIVWEDGHDYGIYNWQYLKALCPCELHHGKA